MRIESLEKEANARRGCLSSLKTKTSHRRLSVDKEDPLQIDNIFVSDEAKILSSKTFRVLEGKTQVFTFPQTPLTRSRRSHVLEVAAISVVAAQMLGLNTDLVRAAALGHDVGHVPLGHQGEFWLAKTMGRPFCHEVMGVIVAQKIERKGCGLNLSWHTLDAMMRHSGNTARQEMSPEAWVLRHMDKAAYIFHDWNDIFVRMGYAPPGKIRQELEGLVKAFGNDQRERTNGVLNGLVIESAEVGHVSFDHSDVARKFKRIRELMYEVYPRVTQQNVEANLRPVLDFLEMIDLCDPFLLLALMTDRDIKRLLKEPMKDVQALKRTTVWEILPHLDSIGPVDLCDPDLDSWAPIT